MKVLCKQQEFNKNFEEVCTWMFFLPRARLDLSYSNLIGKDPDAGKDWRWEEKAATEDKMVGRHHRLHGHEFEQAPGVGDSQWSLACCSPWRGKESDTTEWLNWYWLTDDESTLRASQVALVVKNPPANAVLSRSVKSNSLRPHELQPTRLLCQWGFSRQEYWSGLLCRRHKRWRFDPWIRNIPWRRAWQPTPVFLPRKFHRQRSLVGYSPFGLKRVRQLKQLGTHTKSTCDWDSQRVTAYSRGSFLAFSLWSLTEGSWGWFAWHFALMSLREVLKFHIS